MHSTRPIRSIRSTLTWSFILLTILAAISTSGRTRAAANPTEIHIGYQAGGVWSLLKVNGTLEKAFGPEVKVSWSLFLSGPPLLEAMNAGSIDIGATGDTPPIFAQAAGTPLVYVAQLSGSGAGEAILVPGDSPLKTVADLKGKKVAFTKTSAAHLMLVRALQKFGLQYADITPVFLAPPDARAAFQGGSIDAWVIWDPFRASAIKDLNARALIEGQDVSPSKSFVEASKTFVDAYPDAVKTIVQELQTATVWERANKDQYAQIVGKETGLDPAIILSTLQADIPDYLWIDDDAVAYQQRVADIFFNLALIPDKLNIKDVVWIGGTNPAPTPAATGAATAASQ